MVIQWWRRSGKKILSTMMALFIPLCSNISQISNSTGIFIPCFFAFFEHKLYFGLNRKVKSIIITRIEWKDRKKRILDSDFVYDYYWLLLLLVGCYSNIIIIIIIVYFVSCLFVWCLYLQRWCDNKQQQQ